MNHKQRSRHRAAAFHQGLSTFEALTLEKSQAKSNWWEDEIQSMKFMRAILVKRLMELGAKDIHPFTGEPLDGE